MILTLDASCGAYTAQGLPKQGFSICLLIIIITDSLPEWKNELIINDTILLS